MKKISLIILLHFIFFLHSQDYKFGKVSKEELQETQSNFDPEAEAAILYQHERIYFPPSQEFDKLEKEVFVRIKIYDKDKANEYLSNIVRLHKQSNSKEDIFYFKGVTYNLVDGKIEETKIEKNQIFEEEVSNYTNSFTFNFPNVKNGSVLEYKYTIVSPYIYQLPTSYFQYAIPLMKAVYTVEIPEFATYSPDRRGLVNSSKEFIDSKPWNDRTAKVTTIEYDKVPALKREPFVLNRNNLRSSLRYELAFISIPGRAYQSYSKDWKSIVKTLNESDDFGRQIIDNNDINEIASTQTAGKTNTHDKAFALLNYVQNNYTWNEYYGSGTTNGVRKTLKEKKGNVADLNLLLVNLLKAAGIEAYPMAMSSLYNGVINYSFPSLSKLDYVIVAYKEDGYYFLMDATSKYSAINQLPERALNDRGILVKGYEFELIPISNTSVSREHQSITAQITEKGIEGKFTENANNYFALEQLEEYDENPTQFKSEIYEDYATKISDLSIDTKQGNLKKEFNFEYNKSFEIIGDKIIFNPMLFINTENQIFNSDTRNYNLEFGTPFNITKKVSVKIPEGYQVDNLAEAKSFVIPNEMGSFQYTIKEKNGNIEVFSNLKINSSILSSDYYLPIKQLWQEMVNAEEQIISFKKINP